MQYPASWLQGVSLGESIASELRLQIIKGSIEPGQILSENRIAADFGTSRSPVREALKVLSAEGLIRLERMGAVVLGLSLKDIEELYDVRYLIEGFAQASLAGSNQEGLIAQLKKITDKMQLAAKHNDPEEFSLQDLTFHETIIHEANHSRILHLWNGIRHIVMAVLLITTEEIFTKGEAHLEMVIGKHLRLIEGLESRDKERIQQEVNAYFTDSRHTLQRSLPPL
ncbi:GntR family transcriptional regulator [Paenibacillus sp. CAA11]|uniref:GntR family transcriptional regulator n=1 Tax=Paenibacillus sp. CAA11 TaxID=1532905 RepID=UPI000D3412DF|nr:GntR family transcriptional regulator [Paenibacillus sp. CAA11]AWB46723.1 GntR family transcriptional regulator [Paenibacillus sp. CAA11]